MLAICWDIACVRLVYAFLVIRFLWDVACVGLANAWLAVTLWLYFSSLPFLPVYEFIMSYL